MARGKYILFFANLTASNYVKNFSHKKFFEEDAEGNAVIKEKNFAVSRRCIKFLNAINFVALFFCVIIYKKFFWSDDS